MYVLLFYMEVCASSTPRQNFMACSSEAYFILHKKEFVHFIATEIKLRQQRLKMGSTFVLEFVARLPRTDSASCVKLYWHLLSAISIIYKLLAFLTETVGLWNHYGVWGILIVNLWVKWPFSWNLTKGSKPLEGTQIRILIYCTLS